MVLQYAASLSKNSIVRLAAIFTDAKAKGQIYDYEKEICSWSNSAGFARNTLVSVQVVQKWTGRLLFSEERLAGHC